MPSHYPLGRWRVPDTTQICDRVAMHDTLANEGAQYATVQALASIARDNANKREGDLVAAVRTDPSLARVLATQDYRTRIRALEALRLVQSLPYVHDPAGQEWLQSTDWTTRYGGDCKDLNILLVAIERILDLRAEPYWFTQTGQPINHVTSRVKFEPWAAPKQDGMVWSEASIRGAMLGESPYEATGRLGPNAAVGGKLAPAVPLKTGEAEALLARARNLGSQGVLPFSWDGWSRIWPDWSARWWSDYYPYLYCSYAAVQADPTAFGFVPLDAVRKMFDRIPLGTPATTNTHEVSMRSNVPAFLNPAGQAFGGRPVIAGIDPMTGMAMAPAYPVGSGMMMRPAYRVGYGGLGYGGLPYGGLPVMGAGQATVTAPAGVNAQGQVIDQAGNPVTDQAGNPVTVSVTPVPLPAPAPTPSTTVTTTTTGPQRHWSGALLSLAVSMLVIGGAAYAGSYYGAKRATGRRGLVRVSRTSRSSI